MSIGMEGEDALSISIPSQCAPTDPPKHSESDPSSPNKPSPESDCDCEVDRQGLCPVSRRTVITFSFLSICCVAFIIFFRSHLYEFLNWLQEAPLWETLTVFVLLFTVLAFPVALGYLVLNVAAGYLYGFWWGMLVVVVSVMLGFSVAFHVCRLFLRDWIMDYVRSSKVATALVRIVEGEKGFKVVALARLTPVPFGIQNAVFSATSISYPKCLCATMVGLLPTQCLNTYMGSTLRDMTQVLTNRADGYLLLAVQVVVTAALSLYVVRLAQREFSKMSQENTENSQVIVP